MIRQILHFCSALSLAAFIAVAQCQDITPLPGGKDINKYRAAAPLDGKQGDGSTTPSDKDIMPLEGAVEPEERIFNGQNARLGQFPYQVLLNARDSKSTSYYICGGSIISSTWILTAAHCAYEKEVITIYMGLIYPSKKSTSTQQNASQIIIHPDYNPSNITSDIALLEVANEIEFNDNIQSISLPPPESAEASYWDLKAALVSGWGRTYDKEDGEHFVLQYKKVFIAKSDECKSIYKNYPYADDNLCNIKSLMSEEKKKYGGPCQGDSGGPLASNSVVAGIVSWGVGECGNLNPDVYVNVGSHLDWINENTGL